MSEKNEESIRRTEAKLAPLLAEDAAHKLYCWHGNKGMCNVLEAERHKKIRFLKGNLRRLNESLTHSAPNLPGSPFR